MKLNRAKNTKRGIAFGLINKIVNLLFPFIIRTIIIKKIGSDYLGLNSLFSSILQVLNLSELGFSSAIVFCMYEPIANDDDILVCSLLNFFKKIYCIIGTVILIIGIFILPFLPNFISGEYPTDINIYVVYSIFLLNSVLSYFLFAYKSSLLSAFQRNDILNLVYTITLGMQYILQIIILLVSKNYYVYLVLIVFGTIFSNLLNNYFSNKIFPKYQAKGTISKVEQRKIIKQTGGLMVNKLSVISRNSFDSIFISMYIGLKFTTIYTNYYYIINALIGILSIITTSMLSGIGNSLILSNDEKNYNDMKKITFMYQWIVGFCSISLLCLYQDFMNIWVGKELMFTFSTVILLSLYFYILKMIDIKNMYIESAGLWWENRTISFFEALFNLVLNFVFIHLFGINGVVLATIVSVFIMNFIFGSKILFKYYFKKQSINKYYIINITYLFVTVVNASISYFICKYIVVQGVLFFIFKAIIIFFVVNIIYCLIYCKFSIFKVTIKWIVNVFNLDKGRG